MIPKVIHYCWFGRKELPRKAQKCILSWKKYCPDYDIIEWNEDNFDVNQHPYLKWCYENKKWAFLSDLARLIIVKKNGGIYFDTDVEVIAPFDDMRKYDAFFAFENKKNVASGLGFGASVGHPMVVAMIEQYNNLQCDSEGSIKMVGCPILNTQALLPFGLKLNGKKQEINGAIILPMDYMNPYDDPTGYLNKTENTISIHWYTKSALTRRDIFRSNLTRPFHRIFGKDCFEWIKKKI